MKVLVIGGGGREHALTWKIARSHLVERVFCAPGNAGMAAEPKTTCVELSASDLDGQVRLAAREQVELVVVGPEVPLCQGLVDRLEAKGILALGPPAAGARLEGSKVFAKELMRRHKVPTADFSVFDSPQEALAFVRGRTGPCVIKADGLAAGKGVLICSDAREAEEAVRQVMVERAFGAAGDRLLVEELLEGEEASCIALTDGHEILMLASSQDHKRALDGDQGLNTGGMGAYSPAPVMDRALQEQVLAKVYRPLLAGLREEGIPFRGILYAGLMMTATGPQVLEFNVRFGDPETQALMPRIRSDLVPALLAVAKGELGGVEVDWDPRPAVCVVMAAGGYPERYDKGEIITGLAEASEIADAVVFHAGTEARDGQVVTAGGRVLNVCALGSDIRQAVDRCYGVVEKIHFEGAHFRRDIAARALARLT